MLLLTVLLMAAIIGCGDDPPPSAGDPSRPRRLHIVAVDPPAFLLASRLAAPAGEVTCLIPLDEIRHRRALRPADLAVLRLADVAVVSDAMASDSPLSFDALAPGAVVVRIAFAPIGNGNSSQSDSWAWLDVGRMISAIDACRDALKAAAPRHAAAIDARAESLRAELAALEAANRARFADIPAARRSLLISDPALAAFAAGCGLHVAALSRWSASRQPTSADRDQLFQTIRSRGAAAIIVDPAGNEALAELLEEASMRGPRVVARDPWQLPPHAGSESHGYASLVTHWRDLLATALAP
jgi:ABC-type Zn uptake system ZnuABC Zn-binding protein ZnuA